MELLRQLDGVALRERRQVAEPRRIARLETLGHLGEARVARDERRAAGSRGLRRDHPERLGEDRRHDDGVRERDQVHEMAVFQRPGEERVPRRQLLEPRR